MINEVIKKLDELENEYFDVWEKAGNIESPTNFKEGVDAVGNFFAQMAEERGWKVERSKQFVSGDAICITMNPEISEKSLSLSGHIDTVHPVGLFGSPAAYRDEEKIYGPGVTDCKGGVVAAFYAMDALSKCGYDKRPVKLLIQSDEENNSRTSGKATINYICEKAKDSIAFLNLESYTKDFVTLERKGILSYTFEVAGKESHSSRCATEGANAIADAAYKIIELERFKDDDGITCNCGVVNGGSVVNTIAGKCTFSVNFRFAGKEQHAYIENFVKELAATEHVKGCTCTVTKLEERVSMEREQRNIDLLEKVNKIFEENQIPILTPRKVRGGSDGADVSTYGIPCLDSLGTSGGGSHSVKEFAFLSSLKDAAKRIVAIACEL